MPITCAGVLLAHGPGTEVTSPMHNATSPATWGLAMLVPECTA